MKQGLPGVPTWQEYLVKVNLAVFVMRRELDR